jgi:hypothetical protein
MASTTFPMRYGWWRPLLSALGLGPRAARIELGEDEFRVRMGWGFRARIPRTSIVRADRFRDWPWAIGVHGDFRGSWLVNGSATGIVLLYLDPPSSARVLGVPISLRKLGLSLEDPEGFLAALGATVRPPGGSGIA